MPQDFSGRSLRGHNFKSQDLSGANFSHADIRGANFTEANLSGANFTGAKAGLQKRSIALQLLLVLLVSILSGVLQGQFGYYLAYHFPRFWDSNYEWIYLNQDLPFIVALLITIVTASIAIVLQGFTFEAFITISVIVAVVVPIAVIVAIAVVLTLWVPFVGATASALSGAFTALLAIAGIVAFAVASAFSGRFIVPITVAFAFTVFSTTPGGLPGTRAIAIAGVIVASVENALLGLYVARRANKGDEKFALIRIMSVAFSAIGGTTFYKADLTDANFTKATLKSTHLRQANLTRSNWKDARNLDRARVGDSILADAKVRSLLVTRNGYKKSFVNANLSGANLDGVNLNEANLKGANFHKASLRHADLRGANLTGVQAIETDFTAAAITGACLESWNIDHTTILEKIDCQFVFLLEQANERGDRERRPHDPNKTFEPGDFKKYFREVMDTVQLLLRNGCNPDAFAAAFAKIMQSHPGITPDSIQGFQKKDDDLLVTIAVPKGTDKGQFEQDFEVVYQARLQAEVNAALLEAEKQHKKDFQEITQNIISTLGKNSSHINIMNQSNNPNISSGSGSFINTGGITGSTINLGQISGTVTNAIDQLPTSPQSDRLKELLIELQAAIESDPQLPDDNKAIALNQVKELAVAGQEPDVQKKRSIGQQATLMLKGLVATLPDATKLVEACTKLLPLIGGMIGL